MVYNLIYYDGVSGISFGKRFAVTSIIREKEYDLTMASDGFLPFEDNIYEAQRLNVKHIIQPGGSIRDDKIKKICDKYDINMVITGKRLFTH